MPDRTIPNNSVHDVVTFKLLSEGKDVTYDYEILSLSVNHEVNRIPTAQIMVLDGSAAEETFSASEAADLIPGRAIEIALGYDGNDRSVFKGEIVKQRLKVGPGGDSVMILDCRDAAFATTLGRHSRRFVDKKDSEAIASIFKNYRNVSTKIESTRIQHPEIVQYYATDWDFALSRAEMNEKIVFVQDGVIHLKAPETNSQPIVTLTYGANILEIDLGMDVRHQYKEVRTQAWDYGEQQRIEASSSEPSLNKQGNLTGKNLAPVDTLELSHGGSLSSQELKEWANAKLLKSRLSKIRGTIKIEGFRDAKADGIIALQGMGKRFNGNAYVSGIRHELSSGSWYTYLQIGLNPQWFYQSQEIVERPAAGLLPGVSGLQIGVVAQIENDPDKEDRVLVTTPMVDNKKGSGSWARVATLDAGKNRGSFFRPEVGDEVILGFIQEDPRYPVILGMLHSQRKPAPLQAEEKNAQKGLFTRSGIQVLFDDDKKILSVHTPSKNKVVLSDQDKAIAISDQNGNQITLDSSGITLKSPKDIVIDAGGKLRLKAKQDASIEGMNVAAKANVQFKATGNAGAEVSSSAIAVLKGSLVQIN